MATSTFGKEFKVRQENADRFVREMTRKVPPTLRADFQTKLVHVKDAKKEFGKALKR